MKDLRSLPGVDQVLALDEVEALMAANSRELVVSWVRDVIDELREELQAGAKLAVGPKGKLDGRLVSARVTERAARLLRPSLRRVINATGIAIHTNLGRSPLPPALIEAIAEILGTYSNLEFDLDSGKRGSRHAHLERLIPLVTGAEAGFVVNNNAAAVLVALHVLAAGREVIVSRGELIEIGGSFRVPDIIRSGGARLVEVGTTNKTRLSDYEKAITGDTALLLKVHPSNYKVVGFTEEASLSELVELGRAASIPVMMDLGSGLLIDLAPYGIAAEKPVRSYLETGADVVTFSGDKLLGGPQAGFVTGRREIVERIKQDPMVRALRVGKLTIAALEAMLLNYLSAGDATQTIPTLRLLTRKPAEIKAQAQKLARELRRAWPEARFAVVEDQAFAGGGSLPAEPLPTFAVAVEVPGREAEDLARAFRRADPPVVGRIKSGRFLLDCRTLLPPDTSLIKKSAVLVKEGK